jgi:hypothetical protein
MTQRTHLLLMLMRTHDHNVRTDTELAGLQPIAGYEDAARLPADNKTEPLG